MLENHPDVTNAEKALWQHMSEALAFAQVIESNDQDVAILAKGIIERLANSIDTVHTELLRHGFRRLGR